MRPLVSFVLSCAFALGPALHAAPPPLGSRAADWAASMGSGAVATAEKRDGRWSFALGGQPFPEGHAAVAPERVLFEIGSITKVFTGVLLAQATVEGKVGLDDPLARRLPVQFTHPETGAITLKQLATHTSCLPRLPDNLMNADGPDPYAAYDRKALFEYLAGAKLAAKAPCAVEYSNLGFGILGVVLEVAYDKPWAELIREKIAGPLGMTDTAQTLSPDQEARLAEPWSGKKRSNPWTFQAISGAGALRSTVADMAKFSDALLAGTNGPLGKAWPLVSGDFADWPGAGAKVGLALLHSREYGEDSYSHEGWTGGYRSVMYLRPGKDRGAVVLASNTDANPLAWLIAWASPAVPAAARTKVTLPAALLDEYVGVYSIDKTARFTLIRKGDGLIARLTGQPFFPLYASAKDELFYEVVDAQLSIRRDEAGKVVGLTLHQNGRDIAAGRDGAEVPHVEFPDPAALVEYVGTYDFGTYQPGATIEVTIRGDVMMAQLTGQPAFPVFASGRDRFDYDVVVATLTFERDPAGKVTALTLHQNGLDMRSPKK